jgi:hypothetical protein
MERHWLMPLRINGRVLVVHTGLPHGQVKRGDWIAYRLPEFHIHGVWVAHENCTLGRVMAVAGDEVVFTPHSVLINGESRPLLAYMPTNGTIHVEQGCWIIWPEMAINNEGHVEPGIIEQAMMQMAIAPEISYVGVPYRHWFGRAQTLP